MTDYSRLQDLEDLHQAMKQARSVAEREYLERLAYQIMNESTTVSSLRNELIGAFRAKDMGKVRRLQAHLNYVRLEETRGTSWGSNKGNKAS